MAFADEMRVLYDDYIDTFNRADFPAFLRFFAYPTAVDGPRGSMLIADGKQHLQVLDKVRGAFLETGWTRSRTDKIDVFTLAGDTCLLMIDITRYRADDTVVNRARAYYTFRHLDGAWRIVATVEVPRAT